MRSIKSLIMLAAASLLIAPSASQSFVIEKLKPEDVVARHLESIGTTKAREAVTTRIIAGTSQVIFHTAPIGQAVGKAVLASEDTRNLIGMSFPSPVYPREQLGFNGESFVAAFVTPGVRSPLGAFLMTHNLIFKEGLMGGALSSAWTLVDVAKRSPKLEYVGTKKINSQTLEELRYSPHVSSDLKVSLFFDPETFRHVRTEYERTIAAQTGDRSYVAGVTREIRYKMVEEFSDFRPETGLTLPHLYRINLFVDSPNGTSQTEWILKLTQFTFNDKIDPSSFSISGN
jgi:hypothetical protein